MRSIAPAAIAIVALGLAGCESSGSSLFSSLSSGPSTATPEPAKPAQQATLARIALAPVIGAPDAVSRQIAEQIVQSARDEGVHVIGLSILSGSHGVLVTDVLERLAKEGLDVPVVVGGIIPEDDARALRGAGVRRVYTPKDFDLTRIMGEIVDVVGESPPGV